MPDCISSHTAKQRLIQCSDGSNEAKGSDNNAQYRVVATIPLLPFRTKCFLVVAALLIIALAVMRNEMALIFRNNNLGRVTTKSLSDLDSTNKGNNH